MPWMRGGDNIAFHPKVLAPLAEGGWDLVDAAFGYYMRLCSQSAGHLTDYVVSYGTAVAVAGGPERAERMLDVLERYEYVTRVDAATWRLYDDPEFVHLRLKEEVEWERQRNRDNNRPALNVPVRKRDGDACRFCNRIVNWADRRGGRGGTYEHLDPGQPATIETQVVCCKRCNSARKRLHNRDEVWPLLPVPPRPYYSATTKAYLAKHGETVKTSPEASRPSPVNVSKRPGAVYDPDTADTPPSDPNPGTPRAPSTSPSDPAASGTPRAFESTTSARPVRDLPDQQIPGSGGAGTLVDVPGKGAPADETAAQPSDIGPGTGPESDDLSVTYPSHYREPRFTGSGRDGPGRQGSGRAGQGGAGSGSPPPLPPGSPRARKRSRKGRKHPGGDDA